jgi:transcriptional regulator with XRE-family HTH domain
VSRSTETDEDLRRRIDEATAKDPARVMGLRIAQARKDRGIRQEDLGSRLAPYLGKTWPKQAVSQVENGNRKLDPTEFLAFAIVLDYPLAWFFLPPSGEPFKFPGRVVPLGEVADGPLLSSGDATQALVEEQMAILHELIRAQREAQQRVEGLLSITRHPAEAKSPGDQTSEGKNKP